MAFLVGGANTLTAGYDIDNSLRLTDGDSAVLTDTLGTPTDIDKFTISLWYKRGILYQQAQTGQCLISCYRGATSNPFGVVSHSGSDEIEFFAFDDENTLVLNLTTDREFRDISAWYHIVLAVDTSQGVAANRAKFYINGVQETSFSGETYPDQNKDLAWNQSSTVHYIGKYQYTGATFFDGYISEFYFIDGQQLTPSSFGETDSSGIWKPIDAKDDLTFGDNGYYLEFKNSAVGSGASDTIGADTSGNDRHFTSTNVAVTDQCTDTPTNNFSTMSSITASQANKPVYSEGNCLVTNHANGDNSTLSTMGVADGKWYFEAKYGNATADVQGYPIVGWAKNGDEMDGDIVGIYTPSGSNYRGRVGSAVIANAFDGTPAANDIIGFYLDIDNGTLIVHQNGSDFMGSGAASGLDFSSTTFDPDIGFFQVRYYSGSNVDHSIQFNFGNPSFAISSGNADANGYGNFEYDPTLGGVNYYALCTKNLAKYG